MNCETRLNINGFPTFQRRLTARFKKIWQELTRQKNIVHNMLFELRLMHHNNPEENVFFSTCPVPVKQMPVNEYRDLKESMFFHWAILDDSKYAAKLLAVWVSGLLIAAFLIAGKSVSSNITYVGFYWSAILAKIAVLLCLMQLYTAWSYVHFRLMNQKIAYKVIKSSKTAVWYKPESILTRDRLIARFQVRPVLKRIKQTIFLVLLFLSLNFSILCLNLSS